MRIDVPDPAFTSSARASANFRLALRMTLTFVALLWLVQGLNSAFDLGPPALGVRPRELAGLAGILLAPLQHEGFAHLASNSLPLVVAGTAMLYLYPHSALRVLPAVYLGPGIAVWVFGRDAVHIGASGIVYGLVTYVFAAGLIRRDRRAIAASLLVAFLYGTLIWGVLPIEPKVSWETHLAAALIALGCAVLLRRLDIPPRKIYAPDDDDDPEQTQAG